MDESIIYLSPRPKAKLGYTVSQKRPNFEMVQLEIVTIDFDGICRNIQKSIEQSSHVSVFMQVCFFINFSSFKPDTDNNANFDAVSSKRGNFDVVQ